MYVVKWTNRASLKYYETLRFWNNHNKSTFYSKRIARETSEAINLIKSNPNIGRLLETQEGTVRRLLILRKFSIHYRIIDETIEIVAFWSNAQEQ